MQEALKMEDENGWERLDENLLTRLTGARLTKLNRLWVRDTCKCVSYRVHRIVLSKLTASVTRKYKWAEGEKEKQTWMSRWSDRQSSMVTLSG